MAGTNRLNNTETGFRKRSRLHIRNPVCARFLFSARVIAASGTTGSGDSAANETPGPNGVTLC